MLGQFLITFREVFEASLIIGIIIAFLQRSGRNELIPSVWLGTAFAAIGSIVIGSAVWLITGELSDSSMKLFEGIAVLIAVAVLTGMILWMARQGSHIKADIETRIHGSMEGTSRLSFIVLVFLLVFREGFETILFLLPYSTHDPAGTITGGAGGVLAATGISLLIFVGGMRFDQGKFFQFTGVLLIFLAAGLAGYGVHELIEYQEAVGSEPGWLGSPAFQLDISKESALHHKSSVGSVFAVMFGYSVKMEWARVLIHTSYLAVVLPIFNKISSRPVQGFS